LAEQEAVPCSKRGLMDDDTVDVVVVDDGGDDLRVLGVEYEYVAEAFRLYLAWLAAVPCSKRGLMEEDAADGAAVVGGDDRDGVR
jgi:hypothetical protein